MPNTDRDATCKIDFESMYHRVEDELSKRNLEYDILRKDLDCKEKQLAFYEGVKQTIEVIFGREFYNA